jgi:integrase
MPKIDNQRVRFLSDIELESLLNTLETWACRESVDFITFALLTGFRLGELITLKWESVDFENGYITLADPKGGKTVTIPVSGEALDVLRLRDRLSEYVFPGEDGGRRFDFKGPWLRVCRAAGISDFRFHDLRHNFASKLVSSDVNLATVQVLLSHKDIRTTLKYAHLQPGAAKDAARASGKILTRKPGAEVIDFQEGKK